MKKHIFYTAVFVSIFFSAPYCCASPSGDWQTGINYFYTQDYDNAVTYMKKAVDEDPKEEWKSFLEFAVGTRDAAKDFVTFENERFILRLHPDDKILNYYAFEPLDAAYKILGSALGYFPKHKITVEVYPTPESFNLASSLSKRDMETSGAIGICKFNKIMMLSPRCLAFGFRWMDTFTHEYTHYIIMEKTKNNCPLWLHEGISRYCDTLWRSADGKSLYLTPQSKNILSSGKNKLIPFSKMAPSLVKLETQEEVSLAFAEVATAVDRLLGTENVKEILTKLGAGASVDEAFKKTISKTVDEFEVENSSFIASSDYEKTPGAVLDNTKLKISAGDEVTELVPLEAANYIKLGDKFQRSGLAAAAETEYLKAEKAEPNNPVVLNKLAKLLISQNRAADAAVKLKKAIETNPNYVPSYTNLGNLYFSEGNYKDAAKCYEQSNQINPFNPFIHRNSAECYERLKSEKNAEREYSVVRDLIF